MTLGRNPLRLGQTRGLVRNRENERIARLNQIRGINEEVAESSCRIYPTYNPSFGSELTNYFYASSSCRGSSANHISIHDPYSYMQLAECGMPEQLSNRYIKSYNYVPKEFNFHKKELHEDKDCDDMFMGVELEIDKGGEKESVAKLIQEHLGEANCYVVHDGSLNDGLEIVTHPCTIDYHKSLPYEDLFKQLIDKSYESHNTKTCGLHVHVNRNFFGDNPTIQDLCITKILYLLEKHWDKVKIVARRDSSRYAQRFFMKEEDSMFDLLAKAKGVTYSYDDAKYQIVNLKHKNTIEFRLFKGTLKYTTFIATLEFVRNLVYLCKNKPLEQIQMTTFDEIIHSLESEYLVNYLNERNVSI